jgi:hypothetical protein
MGEAKAGLMNEGKWWREHFPSSAARDAADRAIECLGDEKMSTYIDTWVTAYLKAGGKTPLVP